MLGPLPLVKTAFDYNLVLHATCSGSSHNNEASPFSKKHPNIYCSGFMQDFSLGRGGGGDINMCKVHMWASVYPWVLMRFWMYSIP